GRDVDDRLSGREDAPGGREGDRRDRPVDQIGRRDGEAYDGSQVARGGRQDVRGQGQRRRRGVLHPGREGAVGGGAGRGRGAAVDRGGHVERVRCPRRVVAAHHGRRIEVVGRRHGGERDSRPVRTGGLGDDVRRQMEGRRRLVDVDRSDGRGGRIA